MGKHKRIKEVPIPSLPSDVTLKFSFRCYDETAKYCLSKFPQTYLLLVLKRLKDINRKTYLDLQRNSTVYHFHSVDWSTTTEKSGFPDSYLKDKEAFQFALLGINNQKARIYGALEGNVFYIVWFDLEHKITPSFLKNT